MTGVQVVGPAPLSGRFLCHDIASCLPPIASCDVHQVRLQAHAPHAPEVMSSVVDAAKLGRRVRGPGTTTPQQARPQQWRQQLQQQHARVEQRTASKLAPLTSAPSLSSAPTSYGNFAQDALPGGGPHAPAVVAGTVRSKSQDAGPRSRRPAGGTGLLQGPAHVAKNAQAACFGAADTAGPVPGGKAPATATTIHDSDANPAGQDGPGGDGCDVSGPTDGCVRLNISAPPQLPPSSAETMLSIDSDTDVPQELFAELMRHGREVRGRGQHILVRKSANASTPKLVRYDVHQATLRSSSTLRRFSNGALRPRTRE